VVTAGDAPAERAKGPGFKLSAAVLVGGIVVAIPGVLVCAIGFWHTVFGPTFLVPGTTHLHRGTGTYIVFERTGNRSTYGPLTIARDDGVTIDSRQLLVTGPDGRSVRAVSSSPNESINRGSDHYTSAVEFDAPRAGESPRRAPSSLDRVETADVEGRALDAQQLAGEGRGKFGRSFARWARMPTSGQSGLPRGRRAWRCTLVGSTRSKR
jgi:hypothetical protein